MSIPKLARYTVWCSVALAIALGISSRAETNARHTVLFVLSQLPDRSFSLDPLFELTAGHLRMPSRLNPETNCRSFPPEYTQPSRSYRILFGGSRAGTATLGTEGNLTVTFTGPIRPARLEGTEGHGIPEMALATNSLTLGGTIGTRRAPTPEERTRALGLARSQYSRRGLSPAVTASFAIQQIVSTDLNGDGIQDLVCAFRADERPLGRSHSLFFVAEHIQGSYRLAFVSYHSGAGETYGFEQLVDQIDLDGDGTAELVTRNWGWEWYTYRVYAHLGAGWNRIYEGHGCEGM